jgi:HprK-related kinase B
MTTLYPTVLGLASRAVAGRQCPQRLTLSLSGVLIELRTDSLVLIEELTDYFGSYVTSPGGPDIVITALESDAHMPAVPLREKTPDAGKTRVKEEHADLIDGRIVRKRLTGMVFFMADGLNLAVGPCLANVNQVVNFVNSRYIEHLLKRGGLLCHASACAVGDRAIAIAGKPGAGKSTLALHLLEEGFDFVSNDRLVLTGGPGSVRVRGVPKLPRINPGTILGQPRLHSLMSEDELHEARAMPVEELWRIERKYDVPIDTLYGSGRFRLDGDLAALLILEWTLDGGACRVESFSPTGSSDLLLPLTKSPGLFLLEDDEEQERLVPTRPDPETYGRLLDGVPAFRLSGGVDFEAAVALCMELARPAQTRPAGEAAVVQQTTYTNEREGANMGHEVKVKTSMDIEQAAEYLCQLAETLLAGSLTVQKGAEYVVLSPASPVWVEVEAEQGKHKETFSIEVSWALEESAEDKDALVISTEPPVIAGEEQDDLADEDVDELVNEEIEPIASTIEDED